MLAAVVSVGTAQAASFSPGNNPQADEENILLNTGTQGQLVQGTTNQTQEVINFANPNEELILPSVGQARIEAVDGSFTTLLIQPNNSPGTTFLDLILDIQLAGTGQQSGSVVFTAILLNGPPEQSGPLALAQGSNFFTLLTDASNPFVAVVVSESGDNEIHDIRQVRISGVCNSATECPPLQTPEPGMLALLGGSMLGLVGLASRRRNRR